MSEPTLTDTIAANLAVVRARIERAAARSGRPPSDVRLIAISKTFGPDYVRAAFAAGQADFGENRVQEALTKISATSNLPLHWHLVGHLQSNKARKAVGPFACVQSVDSLDLLRRLDDIAAAQHRAVDVLVQVDLAGEATKFGVPVSEVGPLIDVASALRFARVVGLMLLPPLFEDPEETRPYFRRLRALRDTLTERAGSSLPLRELSMGMSHDFEIAIEEGATMIRVGTAIFGARPGG